MKQESINSFNGGLNTDLNPLTTPNNILTDCLNGTFLTFNGDELSLQNDAGNTTIDYNGSPVSLSPGFYPIGIKEYGGVLYIVSGQKPTDNSTLWVENTSYLLDQIVRYGLNGEMIYYKSKVSSNNHTLPAESDSYWFVIGTLEDYNNYYGKVEIGSYPSPEFSGSTSFVGNTLSYTEANISNILYKSVVINEEYFKSGRYVTFGNTSLVLTYVSSYLSGFTYSPKFYKIKLWHQLNNGYLDLTDDIWQKYYDYKGVNIVNNHWFNDATFKYYCPSQFKGKLAISVEIEDLTSFGLVSIPTLTFNYANTGSEYTLILNPTYVGNGSITVPSVNVRMWLDGTEVSGLSNPYLLTNNTVSISKSFSKENKDKVVRYEITPIIRVNSVDYSSEIPSEYLIKYTLNGSRTLNTSTDFVTFSLNTFNCDPYLTQKTYTSVILKNDNGSNIDNTLTLSSTPYIFLEQNTSKPSSTTVIAYYTVSYGKPVIVTDEPIDYPILPIDSSILTSFQDTTVVTTGDSDCGTVDVKFKFNEYIHGDEHSNMSVIQSGYTPVFEHCEDEDPLNTGYYKTFVYQVYSYREFSFSYDKGNYYDSISYTGTVYNATNDINFALIRSLYATHSVITTADGPYVITDCNFGQLTGTYYTSGLTFNFYDNNVHRTPTDLYIANDGETYCKISGAGLFVVTTQPQTSTNVGIYKHTNPIRFDMLSGTTMTTVYANISNNSSYTSYGDMIFHINYSFSIPNS